MMKDDLTREEILEIARDVKPELPSNMYCMQEMQEEGIWPWADQNTGYVPSAEWKVDEAPPERIAKILLNGGNPFIVDGQFSLDRLNMGYEKALEAHKAVLDEYPDDEADENQQTTPPASQDGEPTHPIDQGLAHFLPAFGPPVNNLFTGPSSNGIPNVAEVSGDNMVDVVAAFSTPIPVEQSAPPGVLDQPNANPQNMGVAQQAPYTMTPSGMILGQAFIPGLIPAPDCAPPIPFTPVPMPQQPIQPVKPTPLPSSTPLQVDQPQKPKRPKKGEADKDVSVGTSPTEVIPNGRDVPPIVQDAAAEARAPVEHEIPKQLTSVFPGNKEVASINKTLGYLMEIERIALENGCQVQFVPHIGSNGKPDDLYVAEVFDAYGQQFNPFKSFTIDTGRIIDNRHKLFPTLPVTLDGQIQILEAFMPFEVFIKGGTKKSGGGKRVNEKMFKEIFVGGVRAISEQPMYSADRVQLNKYVDLSSMRYPNTNLRNRILKEFLHDCLKPDRRVFERIREQVPNSRFRMVGDYDANTDSIKLENVGVPMFYNGPIPRVQRVILTLRAGKAEWAIIQ